VDKFEAFKEALEILKPHFDTITAHFKEEQARYTQLLARDHDAIGRLLKCHLVLEHYLDGYLTNKVGLGNLEKARLRFFQKVQILPDEDAPMLFLKPGILKINSIRNRCAHNLDAAIDDNELGELSELLALSRPDQEFDSSIERIEAFTTLCCTWLAVSPPDIENIFKNAWEEFSEKHNLNQ